MLQALCLITTSPRSVPCQQLYDGTCGFLWLCCPVLVCAQMLQGKACILAVWTAGPLSVCLFTAFPVQGGAEAPSRSHGVQAQQLRSYRSQGQGAGADHAWTAALAHSAYTPSVQTSPRSPAAAVAAAIRWEAAAAEIDRNMLQQHLSQQAQQQQQHGSRYGSHGPTSHTLPPQAFSRTEAGRGSHHSRD